MIYLDNSATTQVDPVVFEEMKEYFTRFYGNPEAKYYEQAVIAKKAIDLARERVSKLINCEAKEVIFNSGATEGNNTVIKGVAEYQSKKGKHIITTSVEHSSVFETCKYLETKGYEVTYLGVNEHCQINIDELLKSIRNDTILISIMWVNNEVGSIFPIKEIAKICNEKKIVFHSDATQAIGKININFEELIGLNFITFSGHKMYGPKGIGVLINRCDSLGFHNKYIPLIHGGEQEYSQRAGTQNVPGIVGIGKACELLKGNIGKNYLKLQDLENKFIKSLREKFLDVIEINNDFIKLPGIINIRFKKINNQILLKNISTFIASSTGSACSNSKPSRTLKAMGMTEEAVSESIRFSFSINQDYDKLVDSIRDL